MDDRVQKLLGEHEAKIAELDSDIQEMKKDVKLLLDFARVGTAGWSIIKLGGALLLGGMLVYSFIMTNVVPLFHSGALPR